MSNYGRAQRGGPWGEGWLRLFPPAWTDASDQERKLLGWTVDSEASISISLLLKSLDSSEQGGLNLRSCSLSGSKREAIAIKARQKEVICELGQLALKPLPLTVLVVPCDECYLSAGLSTQYYRLSQTNGVKLKIIVIDLCPAFNLFSKDLTYFYLISSLQQTLG